MTQKRNTPSDTYQKVERIIEKSLGPRKLTFAGAVIQHVSPTNKKDIQDLAKVALARAKSITNNLEHCHDVVWFTGPGDLHNYAAFRFFVSTPDGFKTYWVLECATYGNATYVVIDHSKDQRWSPENKSKKELRRIIRQGSPGLTVKRIPHYKRCYDARLSGALNDQ